MKYEAEIQRRRISVEIEERNGRVLAKIDRRTYDVEFARPEKDVYLMFLGSGIYEARAWSPERNAVTVQILGQVFPVNIIDRKQRLPDERGPEGRQQLVAPMPGKVVRVLLKPGDQVQAGQGVVVVEAMKMQNEIISSKTGRVIEVRVAEGDTVNARQVLAVVE